PTPGAPPAPTVLVAVPPLPAPPPAAEAPLAPALVVAPPLVDEVPPAPVEGANNASEAPSEHPTIIATKYEAVTKSRILMTTSSRDRSSRAIDHGSIDRGFLLVQRNERRRPQFQ